MPVDKSAIGRTGEPVTMHIERGKIQEFARAIKDDDPLYFDEGHAADRLRFLQVHDDLLTGRCHGAPRTPAVVVSQVDSRE